MQPEDYDIHLIHIFSNILFTEKKMHVHFILHETFEAPAAYLKWAQSRNHDISLTKIYENDPLPNNTQNIDFLIIMGGPQSPDEDPIQFPYYHPKQELQLIQDAITNNKYIVGVCLGAQLLSVAYGAQFEHSPEREIGVFPIRLTQAGLTDCHIQHFGEELMVGHWHGDMPGLVEGAKVLASSEGCPRQIIRFSPKHYAFQTHLEFDRATVELLIAADGETQLQTQSQIKKFIQHPNQIRAYDYTTMNKKLFGFLDSLTK